MTVFTQQTTDLEFYAKMEQEVKRNAENCKLLADVLKRHNKFISWKTEQETFWMYDDRLIDCISVKKKFLGLLNWAKNEGLYVYKFKPSDTLDKLRKIVKATLLIPSNHIYFRNHFKNPV